jgi:hypothetical protein
VTGTRVASPNHVKPKRIQTRLIPKQQAFLIAFRKICNITRAAEETGIDKGMHYRWMRADTAYAAAFEASIPEATEAIEAAMHRLATKGHWEPLIYQGEFRYAKRKRVLCLMKDGTQVFEDELPRGAKAKAKVAQRKTVTTADGEQLGVWRQDAGLMGKLAAAWIPDRYGARAALELTGKDGAALIPAGCRLMFGDGVNVLGDDEDTDVWAGDRAVVSPETPVSVPSEAL